MAKLKAKMLTLTLFCILAVMTVLVQGANMRATTQMQNQTDILGSVDEPLDFTFDEQPPQISSGINISGVVNKPLNFTYAELLSFPMVSEVATLECVDRSWQVTFNWTGVPLFHLLTLAQVKPEAYAVIFHAIDDYSSSITIQEALKPTTILALKANGTLLSEITGREGGFRIAIPCKWGYEWVSNIDEIKVVDYAHKGNWGSSDEENMPNCVPPSTTPALQVFNLSFGGRNFQVESFTNVSITAFNFNYLQKEIDINVTAPSGTMGFADFIVQQDLLSGPYTVFSEGGVIDAPLANVSNLTFLCLTFPEGSHVLKIVGEKFFGIVPDIRVDFNQTVYVGETAIFNASKSTDDGEIVSLEWNFGDGTSGNGAVVSHSYTKEGTYQVVLNVTDNDGLHNLATLTVTARKQPTYVPIVASAVLTTIIGLLIVALIILALKNRTNASSHDC
jgi:hypothetical protein